jgi:hypothetical protein
MLQSKTIMIKNQKKEHNVIKALKQCGTPTMDSGCGIGAMVTLKVDYWTNCHAPRLLGSVFDFKLETGGIMVCCEHGVITHNRSKGDY